MSGIKILNEEPVAMAVVKDELAKIKKKDEELNYRSNKTFDYLQEFAKLSGAKTKELVKKIEDLGIPRLKPEHIVKIVDTLPKHAEEVKAALSGYTLTITNDNAKKVADVVAGYC